MGGYPVQAFTLEELKKYDGREGRPAYIGFMGKVYDVSASPLWKDGKHQATHEAGVDVSKAISFAPHGAGLLGRFPVLGDLKK